MVYENRAKKVRVAAIQMVSRLGKVKENMEHATLLIEQAAQQGAKLIVLPEMCMTGYTITKIVWDMAEPEGGPTERWLRNTSKRLGVYIGAGLVRADGKDFYNTFIIADPEGRVAGQVRKTQTEYIYFNAGAPASHIIDTAIGRIGVGICADTHRTFFLKLMQEQDIDILLMPHAWPGPYKTSRLITKQDIDDTKENMKGYAAMYGKLLGVPAIFVNQSGPMEGGKWPGIMGKIMCAENFMYGGYSTIVDSDLTIKAQSGQDEGIIIADVTMDATRKRKGAIADYGGWVHRGDFIVRKVILPIDINRGKISYYFSGERKRKALASSASRQPIAN